MKLLIVAFMFSLFSYACDYQHKVVTIRNQSDKKITAVITVDTIVTDKKLFYGSKYSINQDSTHEIWSLGPIQDSFFVYIFNEDSVYNNIRLKIEHGIVKKSFLARYLRNTLNKNDTLIYK